MAELTDYSFHLARQHPRWFSIVRECLELNEIVLDNLEQRQIKSDAVSLYQIILMFNYFKATNSFLSTAHLCDIGNVGDAKSVCRKLVDLTINMSYLAQDAEGRQRQYWQFSLFCTQKHLKKIVELKRGSTDFCHDEVSGKLEELRLVYLEYVEEARKGLPRNQEGKFEGSPAQYWSGFPPEKMAKDCGMSSDYVHPYLHFCASVHASMDDALNYFDYDTFSFHHHIEQRDLPLVMQEACRCFWWLSMLTVSAYELKLVGSLYKLLDHFSDVGQEYFGDSAIPMGAAD